MYIIHGCQHMRAAPTFTPCFLLNLALTALTAACGWLSHTPIQALTKLIQKTLKKHTKSIKLYLPTFTHKKGKKMKKVPLHNLSLFCLNTFHQKIFNFYKSTLFTIIQRHKHSVTQEI